MLMNLFSFSLDFNNSPKYELFFHENLISVKFIEIVGFKSAIFQPIDQPEFLSFCIKSLRAELGIKVFVLCVS